MKIRCHGKIPYVELMINFSSLNKFWWYRVLLFSGSVISEFALAYVYSKIYSKHVTRLLLKSTPKGLFGVKCRVNGSKLTRAKSTAETFCPLFQSSVDPRLIALLSEAGHCFDHNKEDCNFRPSWGYFINLELFTSFFRNRKQSFVCHEK